MTAQLSGARQVPQRSSDFDHLGLEGLRQYRRALGLEENRVSYWRRILQARLDTVRGERSPGEITNLRPMLTTSRVTGGRTALIEIVPVDDIPPLPNLEALWDRTGETTDEAERAALIDDLTRAEAQLSAYRAALHRRLAAATAELIARYRDEPGLCLTALPTPRNGNVRHTA